jgi:nitrite reductase (NO-forming)
MRLRRRAILIATAALLVVGLAAAIAVALAGGFDRTTIERVAGGGTKTIPVALVDATVGFDVTPDVIVVDPGTHLILDVRNDGDGVHDLAIDGGSSRTRMLEPGESQRLDLGTITKTAKAWCTLPDHKLAGMTLELRVRQHAMPAAQ